MPPASVSPFFTASLYLGQSWHQLPPCPLALHCAPSCHPLRKQSPHPSPLNSRLQAGDGFPLMGRLIVSSGTCVPLSLQCDGQQAGVLNWRAHTLHLFSLSGLFAIAGCISPSGPEPLGLSFSLPLLERPWGSMEKASTRSVGAPHSSAVSRVPPPPGDL